MYKVEESDNMKRNTKSWDPFSLDHLEVSLFVEYPILVMKESHTGWFPRSTQGRSRNEKKVVKTKLVRK